MSVRTDLTVDWPNRIGTVLAPSLLIEVQDLIDTLRSLEYVMYPGANVFAEDFLVTSEGKVPTGPGQFSIITLILNNFTIGFEARGGPAWVQGEITQGVLTSVDALGADQSPIANNPFVNVAYEKAVTGAILESGVSGLTAIESAQLELAAAIQSNRLYIDTALHQMTVYEVDNVTPIGVWQLYGSDGLPNSSDVFERVRLS